MLERSWQNRRARFNHDWLKNVYLPASGTFLNVLRDVANSAELVEFFVLTLLPQWDARAAEVRQLISDMPDAMSPKTLFDEAPLVRCDQCTRLWLPDLVDALWRVRCSVDDVVDKAEQCLKRVVSAYVNVRPVLPSGSLAVFKASEKQFAELDGACRELAKAIERFPSGVNVV
jgi:hypothetical protein